MEFMIFFPIIALGVYFGCYYLKEHKDDKDELKRKQKIKDDFWLLKQNLNATIDDLMKIYYEEKRTPI